MQYLLQWVFMQYLLQFTSAHTNLGRPHTHTHSKPGHRAQHAKVALTSTKRKRPSLSLSLYTLLYCSQTRRKACTPSLFTFRDYTTTVSENVKKKLCPFLTSLACPAKCGSASPLGPMDKALDYESRD
eukprot:scaffold11042_cov137-Isochrysis_galbana.AAC.8